MFVLCARMAGIYSQASSAVSSWICGLRYPTLAWFAGRHFELARLSPNDTACGSGNFVLVSRSWKSAWLSFHLELRNPPAGPRFVSLLASMIEIPTLSPHLLSYLNGVSISSWQPHVRGSSAATRCNGCMLRFVSFTRPQRYVLSIRTAAGF